MLHLELTGESSGSMLYQSRILQKAAIAQSEGVISCIMVVLYEDFPEVEWESEEEYYELDEGMLAAYETAVALASEQPGQPAWRSRGDGEIPTAAESYDTDVVSGWSLLNAILAIGAWGACGDLEPWLVQAVISPIQPT